MVDQTEKLQTIERLEENREASLKSQIRQMISQGTKGMKKN